MLKNLIEFDEETKVFHLHNKYISYLMMIEQGETLAHLYFGKHINSYNGELLYPRIERGFSGNLPGSLDRTFSRDTLPQEYSGAGEMNYHVPGVEVRYENGSQTTFLKYEKYKIIPGKLNLSGLPSSFCKENEAETLMITLSDDDNIKYDLLYTIFRNYPIIARSVQIRNASKEVIHIEKIASLQLSFINQSFDIISLPGAHLNERHIYREKLGYGSKVFESRRGASSHQMNPFVALVDPNTTEFQGKAYGVSLIYSGNHKFEVEKDQIDQINLTVGINDFAFSWRLKPGQVFQSPEAIVTYSEAGLNDMSQSLHKFVFEQIIRSKKKHELRPVLVNSWEAAYFDFDEEKLKKMVIAAQEAGMEMFVLDDGWFGKRNDDNTSLGDWTVDKAKFPNGLGHFIDYVHNHSLKFGLWFEPEMISIDSNLYRNHPDYLLRIPGHTPSPNRNQYVLDLTRLDVRNNIFDQLDTILKSGKIDYVKWDMNRHISDAFSIALPASQQGEVYHRYILGLYELIDKITSKYPDILFESCSGGGGRFDLGMAYYMPQTWTSDNTDAFARMKIQYGTSLVYPINLMTAHVSASPNEQTGRYISMKTRSLVAMSNVLGYELDLTKLNLKDKRQIKQYKVIQALIQFGKFYRLADFDNDSKYAWEFVDESQEECLAFVFKPFSEGQPIFTITKLAGLNPEYKYKNIETNKIYGGDELMNLGLYDNFEKKDFSSELYHFKRVID
ncbi:alpha-galactosidase [Lactobacillus mulieris]|uniref:Alpha-galactosidase n=1 Tax=Lactobacillus mulieris TaxID=2508708 RepID=A0AAW5WX71_9LACO|nr:alpha-galactosidase [Lactobacillus mulieris]MCZ3622063.1 alpha-galactosidase [Lactobacillus mulieris]MCZ3623760.1 alpha-galactosidase [Lactobacillus mulieris]MCZ3636070.1 alpha-galactosidase [Lactobacillus mulieris]MCZ3689999.1 alpha-galactosidase [Lactobacillus mulieris]MCZ3696178.1 alpha-galactosidase [Lactobacillus mulieris]